MKRKLFFITLLMLFCTTMFGQQHWTMSELEMSFYQNKISYYTFATIDGVDVDNNDIQIAAFHGNELRGCAFPSYNGYVGKYIFVIDIYGTTPGDQIYFKLYKPDGNGGGVEYGSDFTINYNDEYVVPTEIPTMDFYNKHWNYEYVATEYMQYPCVIKIDGVLQERTNLELAAFCGEELRGVARPQKENITEGLDIYMASLKIEGTNNETISFKLYDPTIPGELSTDKTILFDLEYGNQNVVEIDFRNEAVAQIGDTYYKTLADAFAAVQNNQTITLITDVELSSAISFTKDITFTIDGNGKTIKPDEDSTEANSAFNFGQGNDGTVATRIYTIKNIVFDGWTTDHVVRLQGVNATVEGCTFQNCNQADGLGLLTLTSCEAKVKDCDFLNNTCVKAIDINSWGDNSEKNATIEECVFDNNECNTTAVIYRADGPKLVVKDSKFLNNKVNATGNAATLYAGWATNDEITGCYFANNTVTTSHATTKRFASAIFCDGCTVTGNAFANNTATRNGETITTTVAVGAFYGAANVSENYWGGDAPEAGADYTVEFTSKDVVVKTYYKEYDATAGTLSELTRLPWAEFKQGYAGYVGDTETRENISVDLWDVYADNSVVVKIYSADNTLLSTTTLRTNNREDDAPIARPVVKETFTANVVVWGKLSGSWDTDWHVAPSVEYIPNKFEVWCDGVLCDTFVGFNHVDAYMALDGVLKVAKVTNGETITYYASLEKALKALTENATLTFLDNVTIAENWDCRSNGAKITVPVTIDGNGKTLKLTGTVDDRNWNTVFRIEKDATVKNLTIDVTEATGVQRCITTNSSIVADNCTFLGTTNTRYGIIVGEGAGNNIGNVTANINKCNFTNIQAGVSDNANGQDAKSFTITESNFDNSDVVISAAVNVTFNENVMSNNSFVDIRSYAHVGQLHVEAKDNTLQANTADNYNQIIAKLENIDAQEGFLTPVAEIDGKYYVTLQDAFDKGGNVKVLTDISLAEGVTVAEGKTVVLDLNGKKISRDTEAAISSAAITNNGNLTIKDSSEPSTGKVTAFAANPDTQAIPYYASNTITNCGVLTVLSGTIENSTGDEARAAFPIDNNSTSRDAIVNIEGGTITGRGAIRQFANSTTHKNEVNVKGGEVSGSSYAIWVQNPGSGDPKAALNIEGGELSKILMDPNANFEGSITGGTITEVAIWEPDATNPGRNPSGFIKGGTFGMDVTEFCAFNYVCTSNGDGTYGIEYKQQENNAFVIETLHELEAFRDAVNAGNDFSGQTVVLSGDVNLAVTRAINNWEPIGTQANPFKGTFDGGDNTISNLLVVGENNVGLFGYATSATIKNVKLENVNVKGTDCVGAIAGQVYSTSLIDNCHVSGLIQVEGQTNVGGIVGKYYTKVKNCSVIGDGVATSYVKGTHKAENFEGDNIGGIMGHGGEDNRFENNTVKNITISGTRKVAGIVGVTDMNTQVKNCVVEDVNIVTTATVEYANSKKNTMSNGTLVGSYTTGNNTTGTVESCVVKNVNFLNPNNAVVSVGPITGGLRGGTDGMLAPTGVTASNNNIYMSTITGSNNLFLMNPVAKIGTTEYYTLFDAVAAVQDGETITMLRNTAEEFAIDNTTANITLDMAGFTLTGAITPSEANLTIENGTINNENASYSAIEINAGTLVLNDVIVTSKRHGVRIDGAVTATINGGEYRLSATSGTRHAVNVSGAANVTIKAGTFEGPAGTTMDSGSAVCVQSGAKVTIEGGDFSGGKNATLGVSGTMTVTGGTFDQDVTAYCPNGYVCQMNADNKYEVFFAVASITNANGTLYYASLQAAINAAENGETVKVEANVEATVMPTADSTNNPDNCLVYVANDKTIIIDLNGKTITVNGSDEAEYDVLAIRNHGNLTITDSNATAGTIKLNYDGTQEDGFSQIHSTILNFGTLTIDKVNIVNNATKGYTSHAIFNYSWGGNAILTINGGVISSVNKGYSVYSQAYDDSSNNRCEVYINGGTLSDGLRYDNIGYHAANGANVVIIGGVFETNAENKPSLYIGGNGTTAVAISGGTFSEPVLEEYCAAGYIPQDNGNGTYGVKPGQYVAQVGDVKYETLVEAVAAVSATDNEIIILANSTESVSVPADVIINLNEIETGASITAGGNLTFKGNGSIKTLNSIVGGTITVENGKTLALNNFSFGSSDNASATYTITGGTITANYGFFQHGVYALYSNFETGYMYYSYGSDITVYGTFHSEGKGDGLDYVRGKLTIANGGKSIHDKTLWVGQPASWGPMEATLIVEQGGYVKANRLSVYSGSALQIDATGLTGGETIDEVECNTLIVEGTVEAINNDKVMAVVEGNKIIIKAKPVMIVETDAYYATLAEAFAAANNQTVKVLQNITLTETVTIAADKTVTLDLNGKNLTGGANVNLVIDGELTIKDNVGNAVSTFRNHYVSEGGKLTLKSGILQNIETNTGGYGIFIENGGESIIEGGTVQAVNESNYAICVNGTLTIVDGNIVGKHGVIAVENPNAIVTIEDGEYTLNAITGNSDHIVYVYAGMVNIEGGYFTFNNFIANEGDSMIDADKENVSITGGTYTHDVNYYCHEYYAAIQGADDLWRVEQVLFAQTTALHQGWNWYSSYVNLSTPDGLEKLQTALGKNGVIIKSNINNEFVTYEELPNGEYGWVGNEFSIYNNKMYMIETSNAHEMTVAGEVVDGTGIMFMLEPGWNWIGYPIDKVQNIDVALSGLQDKAQANDMIKHRNDFAYFDASTKKWVGTLTQLEPGKGYKYKSNKSSMSMFYYTKSDAKETVVDNAIIDENYWKVESSGYANNMTITAMLSIDGEIVNDNYEIAAFANGECRGSARPIYVESKNAYMLFMTVFGDDVEELTFKYYDIDADTEYELSNVMNYSNDAIVGTIDNPYIFSMNILGIGENLIDNINIYPNPTTTDREINLQAICDKVEVFNALGVKVAEYHNVDTLDAFETAGIYVIRITNDNAVKHCRLVVK